MKYDIITNERWLGGYGKTSETLQHTRHTLANVLCQPPPLNATGVHSFSHLILIIIIALPPDRNETTASLREYSNFYHQGSTGSCLWVLSMLRCARLVLLVGVSYVLESEFFLMSSLNPRILSLNHPKTQKSWAALVPTSKIRQPNLLSQQANLRRGP